MTIHQIGKVGCAPDQLPFVQDFRTDVRQALLASADVATFEKGDRLLRAGEVPRHLGIVVSGMVELCGTMRSAECGVLLLTRGDLIFPMAFLHGEPCLTSATALTRCRILLLERKAVVEQAGLHPELAMAFTRVIGAQFRMAVRHIIDLKCRSAAERLAAFLLRFVDHSEDDVPKLPFTKATLASRLGVSRETLSRIIQVVADNGIVLRGNEIVVRDRDCATRFCGPEHYVYRGEQRLDVYAF